jgi:KDO2-lipid IV(A) lauroyltransferase
VEEVPVDADALDREAEVVRLTAACAAIQERAIRRHPAEWVWMHQRWKTRPPAEAERDATPVGAARDERAPG